MNLGNMISSLRIELQDMSKTLYTDGELTRAIEKSVSLMSRMIPKRSMTETTIVRAITSEALTIASSTGTLAYKPIRKDSLTITGKILDTDYHINYLTGVITEIGALLPDADYTVSYELDPSMLDLSTFLTDYVKIERIEYPSGGSPASLLTFDLYGNILAFRGTVSLSAGEHLRVIYLGKWTPPTQLLSGNYPSHLDDGVIIGSSGQALIYKAEKYTQESVDTIADIVTLLATLPTIPATPTPTLPSAPVITPLVAPTAPTLTEPTTPGLYTIVKPTSPTLVTAPTAPTAPTPSFTAVESALDAVATEILAAKAHHTTGAALANAAVRGESPSAVYGNYAGVVMEGAGHKVNEAIARLRQIEEALTLYASEVTSYGSEVNAYANNISGQVGKYREDINNELAGIQKESADTNVYSAKIQYQNTAVNKYQVEVASFQAQVADDINELTLYSNELNSYGNELNFYTAKINAYSAEVNAIVNASQILATQVTNYLDIAGRYLASGQSKINEMLASLGVKAEFLFQKSSSEQR